MDSVRAKLASTATTSEQMTLSLLRNSVQMRQIGVMTEDAAKEAFEFPDGFTRSSHMRSRT